MRLFGSIKGLVVVACLFALTSFGAEACEEIVVGAGDGGRLEFSSAMGDLRLRMVHPKWLSQAYAGGPIVPDSQGVTHIDFVREAKGDSAVARATGELHLTQEGRTARAVYRLDLPEAIDLEQVGLQGSVPRKLAAGGTFVADGREFRSNPAGGTVCSAKVRKIAIKDASGRIVLAFAFDKPNDISFSTRAVEDGGTGTLRIIFSGRRHFEAGSRLECAFCIGAPGGVRADDGRPVRHVRDDGWVPFRPDADIIAGSACDYSSLRGTVEPCGTHGHVVVRDAHFEFEELPGVPQRFYGANVCFNACYPDKEQAKRLVELLCRAGYNSVRLHHYDRELTWDSPDATGLDPARMDRLDHFLSLCYRAGLYVTTDFFVGRLVPRKAVGLEGDGRIGQQEFKGMIYTNAALRANFKAYIGNFLGHVNAYTGRRYGDEPGLFAIAFINEGSPIAKLDWATESVALADAETELAADLKRYVREEAKSRVLVTDMSSGWSPAAYQLPRAKVYDYVDSHHYYDHPRFPVKAWHAPWRYQNGNMIRWRQFAGAPSIALTRLFDRPFVSTEWNYCAPSAHRAAGALLFGAQAAAQDWDGVWRFEWTMNTNDATRLDFPEPFHATGFDTPGDPLQLVGEGLFAALFLRRDLAPLKEGVAVTIDERTLRVPKTNEVLNVKQTPWLWAAWRARLGTLVTDAPAPKGLREWKYPEAFAKSDDEVAHELPEADNVRVDVERGIMTVATPRTCALYAEEDEVTAGVLSVRLSDAPAAVWAIALDGQPLAGSRRILLAHVTNVWSTDMLRRERSNLIVFDHGKLPFLMRRGRADVTMDVPTKGWTVYALSPGGRRLRKVGWSRSGDGRLKIACDTAADPDRATFLYELCR